MLRLLDQRWIILATKDDNNHPFFVTVYNEHNSTEKKESFMIQSGRGQATLFKTRESAVTYLDRMRSRGKYESYYFDIANIDINSLLEDIIFRLNLEEFLGEVISDASKDQLYYIAFRTIDDKVLFLNIESLSAIRWGIEKSTMFTTLSDVCSVINNTSPSYTVVEYVKSTLPNIVKQVYISNCSKNIFGDLELQYFNSENGDLENAISKIEVLMAAEEKNLEGDGSC